MKALDSHFHKIINGASQFIIPVFQRDYSWPEDRCDQLWADVIRVGRSTNHQGHFMGSMVYAASGDSAAALTRWLLIDGQQRMTTLTLLLLALRKHILTSGWKGKGDDSPTANRIEAYFLKNVQEEGGRRLKLVLRRHDQAALQALLEDQPVPPGISSRVVDNYEHFVDLIANEDPDVVYRGINRLVVVDCKLDAHDDPQLVFESLNSTGLDLSQADLIRNFILMRLPEAEQTRLYETQWRHIEDCFRGESKAFDSFARDYLALKTRASRQARVEDIYYQFREFFRNEIATVGAEQALAEMRRHARYYAAFLLDRGTPKGFSEVFRRLHRQAEIAAILVMRLMDISERAKTLNDSQLQSAIELLESYVVRRSVCGLQTRNYWQLFSSLSYKVNESTPLESLGALLHGQREGNRFPKDEEFTLELERRDIYNMRTCHYLLDRLENFGSKERTNADDYTIEHVMPQNEKLPQPWRDMLGSDWTSIQKTWVHRLGNLTLTGYNSEYSDRSFEEKKTIKGGFNDSSVRLNKFIREQAKWTGAEMETRGKELAKRAAQIWRPLLVSESALRSSKQDELKQRAAEHPLDEVPMSPEAKNLFDALRPKLLELHADVIEVPTSKTIVYHAPDGDYFLEVLPRKHRLILLLNLEPNELVLRDDNVRSSDDTKYLANASQEGGTFYRLRNAADIGAAMKIVRQAFELAAQ